MSTWSHLGLYIYFCSIFRIIPKAHHHKPMSNGIKIQLTCSASPNSLLPWAAESESRMSHEAKKQRDEEKTMEINRSASLGLWSWHSSASSLLTFFLSLLNISLNLVWHGFFPMRWPWCQKILLKSKYFDSAFMLLHTYKLIFLHFLLYPV